MRLLHTPGQFFRKISLDCRLIIQVEAGRTVQQGSSKRNNTCHNLFVLLLLITPGTAEVGNEDAIGADVGVILVGLKPFRTVGWHLAQEKVDMESTLDFKTLDTAGNLPFSTVRLSLYPRRQFA